MAKNHKKHKSQLKVFAFAALISKVKGNQNERLDHDYLSNSLVLHVGISSLHHRSQLFFSVKIVYWTSGLMSMWPVEFM